MGSEEQALLDDLRAERFSIRDAQGVDSRYASLGIYNRHAFPCRETWTVLWRASAGTITAVEGRDSGDLCL